MLVLISRTGLAANSLRQAVRTMASKANANDVVLRSHLNGVTTITMNDPKKLNGWTEKMLNAVKARFDEAEKDEATKVLILTGKDPYYCAGVNLSATIKLMHPKKLYDLIEKHNAAVFNAFIDFPKPIIIAANGPAIGACVTSATLCDAIVASEKATFLTPFHRLAIPPEGCSSVHFERIMGAKNAERMLGKEGWKPTAQEAFEAGFVHKVVKHEDLMSEAQKLAEQFIKEGKVRNLRATNQVEEYRAINAYESSQLAAAFLSANFLNAQYEFLKSKGKTGPARVFWMLKTLRPMWSKML